MNKLVLGVSSCLMGQEVRHDGGHRKNKYVVNELSRYFDYTSFCPEMASGMGTPRPSIRLFKKSGEIRLVGGKSNENDFTDSVEAVSLRYTEQLKGISGYILKKDSPSCGLHRVRIWNESGQPEKKGTGVFARVLQEQCPNLPIEEEGRLMDPVLRENFIERVYIYSRWQVLEKEGLTVSGLMKFHQRHKLNLLSHDEVLYRELGPLVASVNKENLDIIAEQYISLAMKCLSKPASPKRHTNVLMHLMGYLKKELSAEDKQEMSDVLHSYRLGRLPLVVPITLLKHHLRKFPVSYLSDQYYLQPYPDELMLRNAL